MLILLYALHILSMKFFSCLLDLHFRMYWSASDGGPSSFGTVTIWSLSHVSSCTIRFGVVFRGCRRIMIGAVDMMSFQFFSSTRLFFILANSASTTSFSCWLSSFMPYETGLMHFILTKFSTNLSSTSHLYESLSTLFLVSMKSSFSMTTSSFSVAAPIKCWVSFSHSSMFILRRFTVWIMHRDWQKCSATQIFLRWCWYKPARLVWTREVRNEETHRALWKTPKTMTDMRGLIGSDGEPWSRQAKTIEAGLMRNSGYKCLQMTVWYDQARRNSHVEVNKGACTLKSDLKKKRLLSDCLIV